MKETFLGHVVMQPVLDQRVIGHDLHGHDLGTRLSARCAKCGPASSSAARRATDVETVRTTVRTRCRRSRAALGLAPAVVSPDGRPARGGSPGGWARPPGSAPSCRRARCCGWGDGRVVGGWWSGWPVDSVDARRRSRCRAWVWRDSVRRRAGRRSLRGHPQRAKPGDASLQVRGGAGLRRASPPARRDRVPARAKRLAARGGGVAGQRAVAWRRWRSSRSRDSRDVLGRHPHRRAALLIDHAVADRRLVVGAARG